MAQKRNDNGAQYVDRTQILARLQVVLRDFFNDPELEVTETTSAEDIPDWDSLANVNLILAVEREFGCQFDTDEIGEFQNIGDMTASILAKI